VHRRGHGFRIRPWHEINPVRAYLVGLSFAIWRDFRYQLTEQEHFIVNSQAFESFSRGLSLESNYIPVGPGAEMQRVINDNAYNWGSKIRDTLRRHILRYRAMFGSRIDQHQNILRKHPIGFPNINMDQVYDGLFFTKRLEST